MNFDGFSGLALAVVAGLWLLVFVPSWFKRAQDRERGVVREQPRTQKTKRNREPAKRPPVDNFVSLARDYAESANVDGDEMVDSRDWQRNLLPEPTTFNGTLEVVQLAEVATLDEARTQVAARKLEQAELDEILRRRRANG
jgi:hypothetical protein